MFAYCVLQIGKEQLRIRTAADAEQCSLTNLTDTLTSQTELLADLFLALLRAVNAEGLLDDTCLTFFEDAVKQVVELDVEAFVSQSCRHFLSRPAWYVCQATRTT